MLFPKVCNEKIGKERREGKNGVVEMLGMVWVDDYLRD